MAATGTKLAVTEALALLMVTVQLPVPVQAPDQPVKTDCASGVAISVTVLPSPTCMLVAVLHEVSHWMPAGVLITVPLPMPALFAVNVYMLSTKLAVTVRLLPLNVTVQGPVPVHAPDQPVKVDWALGAAVRVTVLLSRACIVPVLQAVSH